MSLQNEEICLEETGATVLHFIVIEYNEILGREHSTGILRMIWWGSFVGFSFCKASSQIMYRWCCTNHAVRCKVHIRMQQRNGRKSWTTETWRIGTEMLTSYLRKLDGMLGISWDVFHHLTSPWPMVSAPWPFVNWCVLLIDLTFSPMPSGSKKQLPELQVHPLLSTGWRPRVSL